MFGKSRSFLWFPALALILALAACGQMTPQTAAFENVGESGVVAIELPKEGTYPSAAEVCEWLRPGDATVPWFGAWVDTAGATGEFEALGVRFVISDEGGYQSLAWNAQDAFVKVTGVVVKDGEGGNSYSYPIARSEDKGLTAPLTELGNPADIAAFVVCGTYTLTVEKTAETRSADGWEWDVVKLADVESLVLGDANAYIHYDVRITATGGTGSFEVFGGIHVRNDTPVDVLITEIRDYMTLDDVGTSELAVTCSRSRGDDGALGEEIAVPVMGDFDSYLPLAPGEELFCDYAAELDGAHDGRNKAKVGFKFLHGDDYAWDAAFAHADVTFGEPTGTGPECVYVVDSLYGSIPLPHCAYAEESVWVFNYELTVGTRDDADVVVACGDDEVVNVIRLLDGDTVVAEDSVTVAVYAECEPPEEELLGCTLTQGYWKNHSAYGPARYDDTWALVGEDTAFYDSGYSYYGVLQQPPAGGNAYLILAHQYVAAYLNGLGGASYPADVSAAMADAESYFAGGATPGDSLSDADRDTLIALAALLDSYNNGNEGVPHCDGDGPEVTSL